MGNRRHLSGSPLTFKTSTSKSPSATHSTTIFPWSVHIHAYRVATRTIADASTVDTASITGTGTPRQWSLVDERDEGFEFLDGGKRVIGRDGTILY